MTIFEGDDLIPLWDRGPDFLPLRPRSGLHHWRFANVREELLRVSGSLGKEASERRVALLAHPELENAAATDGLHVGIQMLLGGESADAHRHTPSALRIGLEASDTITTVNEEELLLGPLDLVLNPSGTWHGHVERGGTGAFWLDVVDLPLVSALGGVLFEPSRSHRTGALLDPPTVPPVRRFAWEDVERSLVSGPSVDGIRTFAYGDGAVLPTIAVTAYAVDRHARLQLPARTCGAVVLNAGGSFDSSFGSVEEHDVVSLRSWTPLSLTAESEPGTVIVIDTAPALRTLGLYREETGS